MKILLLYFNFKKNRMVKKSLLFQFLFLFLLFTFPVVAQQDYTQLEHRISELEKDMGTLKNLKISGYIQADMNLVGRDGSTQVGESKTLSKWDNGNYIMRSGIRRARLKFQYTYSLFKGVIQTDMTEGSYGMKDIYIQMTPQTRWLGFRIGLQDRAFGHELSYSSSKGEAIERTLLTNKLFNGEKDLGGILTLTAPKGHMLYGLAFRGGFFNGRGIAKADDGQYDFMGRLTYGKKYSSTSFNLGTSIYLGKVYNSTYNKASKHATVYEMNKGQWIANYNYTNNYLQRRYFGIELQAAHQTSIGTTHLRTEYIFGNQPSTKSSFEYVTKHSAMASDPTTPSGMVEVNYLRSFRGLYVYLIQDIGKSPFSTVLRYCNFDPNTKQKNTQVTNKTDVHLQQIGLGGLWKINKAMRLMAYYELSFNEKCERLAAYYYDKDLDDNALYLRLQYVF